MELHIMTPLCGSPTLDPVCLAAAWICDLSEKDIAIIPSNNVHLSPTKTLPVLLIPYAEPVHGLVEIAAHVLDRELDATELALVAYLQQLSVITQHVLFVIPENYEAVTRPEISARIAFPLQYNAALSLQRQAQLNQPAKSAAAAKPPVEAVSELHADMLKQHAVRSKLVNSTQQMMQQIARFSQAIDTVLPLLADRPADCVAKLFFSAQIVLLSLPKLPVQPLKTVIEQHSLLLTLRNDGVVRNVKLRLAKTQPNREYTLLNTLKAYTRDLLAK